MEETSEINEPTIKSIVTEKAEGNNLVKETTYSEIPVNTTSINMDDIKAKIAKIDSAIAQWNSKKAPLQVILDRYNELKPVVVKEEVEEVILDKK